MKKHLTRANYSRRIKMYNRITDVLELRYSELSKIYYHYGVESQLIKTVEELSELQKEICKLITDDYLDKEHFIEELADVIIMLAQIMPANVLLSDVAEVISRKIDRTLKRISNDTEKED